MAVISMKQLLEAGVHFGHQTRRWNPKMAKFIFTERNGIYIIDLSKTVKKVEEAYSFLREVASQGEVILFVGTKKQAGATLKEYAEKCGMPYVSHRWLGGMLTNFSTIKQSIRKLEVIETMEEDGSINLLTKKEALMLRRKKEKLELYLGGIRNMKGLPDMIFVIDVVKEKIAVAEANRLKMPVIAPLDTNCDPDVVDFPIPGNDDAIRSVQLFCQEMAEAINEGKALRDQDTSEDVEQSQAVSDEEKEEVVAEAMSEEDFDVSEDEE